MKQEIKINDVFKASYTESYREKKKGWDLNHCFEGLLVAKQVSCSEIMLFDTFWGVGRTDGGSFKLSDIDVNITLSYYCNLDKIEETNLKERCTEYYDNDDIIVLHDQHACSRNCTYYYLKMGAKRSKEKMKETANRQIKDAEYKIESANRDIRRANEQLLKIDSEYLTMYL